MEADRRSRNVSVGEIEIAASVRSIRASPSPDQPLAGILAAIKTGDGSRRVFDAVQYVLGIAQPSVANPLCQAGNGLFEPGRIVEDDESLHACALDQQVTLGARTVGPGIPV